jgi:hypothetical protein
MAPAGSLTAPQPTLQHGNLSAQAVIGCTLAEPAVAEVSDRPKRGQYQRHCHQAPAARIATAPWYGACA